MQGCILCWLGGCQPLQKVKGEALDQFVYLQASRATADAAQNHPRVVWGPMGAFLAPASQILLPPDQVLPVSFHFQILMGRHCCLANQ